MITCEAHRLGELFRLGVFEPASVQREYQWTTKESGQLLADLFEAFTAAGFDPPSAVVAVAAPPDCEDEEGDQEPLELGNTASTPLTPSTKRLARSPKRAAPKDYFLGPMVLLPAPRAVGKHFIYDGLQRFTTLSILLSVLRDTFESGDTESWYELQHLLRTDDATAMPRLRATTPGGSLATITGSLGGSRPPWRRGSISDADLKMRDAAQLFHERTQDWTDDRRRAFVKFLREHAHFAVTTVSDRSMAYKIFVTANDRGLSLQVGDIIKGRLVDLVAEARGPAAGDQIATKWATLQRQTRPHFDDFLRAVDFLEFGEFRPSTYGEALLDRFESADAAGEVVAWVSEDLPDHAARFATLFAHERLDTIEGPHIPLRQLYFLEDRQWRPVAMALQWLAALMPRH